LGWFLASAWFKFALVIYMHRLLLCAWLLTLTVLGAEPRLQTRSMVISQTGIVATEQPLASQVGAAVLAQGGNAADAIIAANAVMGLVSPMMCGIGGDMFCLFYDAPTK